MKPCLQEVKIFFVQYIPTCIFPAIMATVAGTAPLLLTIFCTSFATLQRSIIVASVIHKDGTIHHHDHYLAC